MSEATAVATAPAVDSSLPYNDAVPGAVVGAWAEETEKALFVAPDKLIDLLTHLRDKEQYDLLANLTCVDYQAYKGKARAGIAERFDVAEVAPGQFKVLKMTYTPTWVQLPGHQIQVATPDGQYKDSYNRTVKAMSMLGPTACDATPTV